MNVVERIHQQLERLPESLRGEVLDFVEYLLTKSKHQTVSQEASQWSSFSLALAMRGMENEDLPEYTIEDLQETF